MLPEEKEMEVLELYDLTESYRDTAVLCGIDHHTVARVVAARALGAEVAEQPPVCSKLAGAFISRISEWVDRSNGPVRADVAQEKLNGHELHRLRAHHPPGGRSAQKGLQPREPPGVQALGDRAGRRGRLETARSRTPSAPDCLVAMTVCCLAGDRHVHLGGGPCPVRWSLSAVQNCRPDVARQNS
jgi:hypothetical protein